MKYLILLALFLTGCATTSSQNLPSREVIGLEGLDPYEVSNLDKGQYFLAINSKAYKTGLKKRASIIFINNQMKQKNINLNTVNLRYWLKNQLAKREYFIDRLSPLIQIAVLVEYGVEPVNSPAYQQKFDKVLFNRYLKVYAIDYAKFKNSKKVDIVWDVDISSLGPSEDLSKVLPVLASFIPDVLEQNLEKGKKVIVPQNDPRLEATKEVPTSIPVDDFKPTVDELNFFN